MNEWKWYYFVGILLGLVTGLGILAWILYKDDIRAKWAECNAASKPELVEDEAA